MWVLLTARIRRWWLVAVFLWPVTTLADDVEPDEKSDSQEQSPLQLSHELTVEYERQDDRALGAFDYQAQLAIESDLELALAAGFNLGLSTMLIAERERAAFEMRQQQEVAVIDQLWLAWQSPASPLIVTLGRFELAEPSAWFWDTTLSGIDVQWQGEAIHWQLAAMQESVGWSSEDWQLEPAQRAQRWLLFAIQIELGHGTKLAFQAAAVDDQSARYAIGQQVEESAFDERDESLRWYGARVSQALDLGVDDQLMVNGQLAFLTGNERLYDADEIDQDNMLNAARLEISGVDRRNVEAWAIDLWLHWFRSSSARQLSIGYLQTSDSDESISGAHTGFRQSGLHDNDQRVRAHSLLADLSYSDVRAVSLIVSGEQEWGEWQLHAHQFWRLAQTREFEPFDLDLETTQGGSDNLGFELGARYQHEMYEDMALLLGLSRLEPGDAFERDARPVILGQLELSWSF